MSNLDIQAINGHSITRISLGGIIKATNNSIAIAQGINDNSTSPKFN
jgi:hypothetical protein